MKNGIEDGEAENQQQLGQQANEYGKTHMTKKVEKQHS